MFSVVITAYDQSDVTAVHVRECMRATVLPDEIIVVNDHGDPTLKEKLKALKRNTKIIYAWIKEDIPWNYTGARNLGFWLSRGDFLSYEDTDNIPSETCYEVALKYMEEHPEAQRVLYGRRPKITREVIVSGTAEDWMKYHKKTRQSRPRHNDTQMFRREVYMTMKGSDERFATRYAWACADFSRRMQRAGLTQMIKSTDDKIKPITHVVSPHFYAVYDAGTIICECGEDNRKMDGGKSVCLKCGLPIWRKSYKNYDMAREADPWGKKNRGHTQSPIGIINFTYEYEII